MENWVLVTGGTGGIGKAIVWELAKAGHPVVFSYRSNEESAKSLKTSLIAEMPEAKIEYAHLDLSSEDAVNEFVETAQKSWGTPYGIINNAGIAKDGLTMRYKYSDFQSVLQTNLGSSFLLIKGFMRNLLKARKGRIVNISSVVASSGNPGQSAYCASKGGLEAMTRSLALEMSPRGITVNCIAPGFIETAMTDALNDSQKESISKNIPMGRIGKPHEIAAMVSFLLGDGGSYITGQTLHINGGLFLT